MLENVAATPVDGGIQPHGTWREVARGDLAVRKATVGFHSQLAITRADFANRRCGRIRKTFQYPQDAAFVAHQEIDAAEIKTRAPRGWIVVREMIEYFGFDDAGFHSGSEIWNP